MTMRVAGVIAGGLLVSACSLLTPLDDLRGDGGGSRNDSGSSSIAYVQGRVVHDAAGAKTSWTSSLSLPNIAAHDTIVVGAVVLQSGPPINTITVSDDQGDAFVLMAPITSYDGWVNLVVASAFDVAGAASTIVTIDAAGTAIESSDLFVVEYSGISAKDATSNGNGHTTGVDAILADPVKLNGAADLVVALAYTDGTASAGTNFTKRFAGGNDASLFEDRITSASGVYGATATMSASGTYWVMEMTAFE